MVFEPLKKVGESASFKGLKGAYLTTFLFYVMGVLFLLLFASLIPISIIFKFLLFGISLGILAFKFKSLKELSKGDLNKSLKDNCKKNIFIKASKFEIRKNHK